MTRMFNPAHPGRILRNDLEGRSLTVLSAAVRLGIPPEELAAILDERAGISAELSEKLAAMLDTSPEFWHRMQVQHDDWVAIHDK